jgi:hypothetical protein
MTSGGGGRAGQAVAGAGGKVPDVRVAVAGGLVRDTARAEVTGA